MWRRPALAFLVALVGVVLVIGVVALLRDDPSEGQVTATTVGSPTSTAIDGAPTTAAPTTSAAGEAQPGCPDASVADPGPQEDLPEAVAEMRAQIVAAALACDVAALEDLAGPDLVTSFGGGGPERFAEAAASGEPLLTTLVAVLGAPHAAIASADGTEDYVWPSAFAYDTWDEIPEADREALLAIYTEEELDEIASFGSYAGWRAGITSDGDWRFFVAGD
jgi:hypothetical protein